MDERSFSIPKDIVRDIDEKFKFIMTENMKLKEMIEFLNAKNRVLIKIIQDLSK